MHQETVREKTLIDLRFQRSTPRWIAAEETDFIESRRTLERTNSEKKTVKTAYHFP